MSSINGKIVSLCLWFTFGELFFKSSKSDESHTKPVCLSVFRAEMAEFSLAQVSKNKWGDMNKLIQ